MVQTITTIMIIATVVISIALIVYAVYYKIKEKEREEGKRRRKSASDSGGKKKKIMDSTEFVKEIEDIRDGILITDDATRFISAITCRGVGDFYDQSASEQMMVMKGYKGFINTITGPMTYRMYTKELNMDYTMKKYSDRRDEFIQKYKFLEASLIGIPKEQENERAKIKAEMDVVMARINHMTSEMNGISYYSSSEVAMEQVQDYVFEWKYRSADFDTDLTPGERFVRASMELSVMASAKIAALSSAGVKARVCTEGELIDICRRVAQPISVERFRMQELESSSYFDDIITSDSMKNMSYVVADEEAQKSRTMFQNIFSQNVSENESEVKMPEAIVFTDDKKKQKKKKHLKVEQNPAEEEEVFSYD